VSEQSLFFGTLSIRCVETVLALMCEITCIL
jgi:hypothetical protein